ncbi:pullulanase-type alpha-1,6-glucosidase [Nonomuraea sp. NPDC050663]|uniref:pullulanase-type alpha-1,6-glucosidase n=1 Tax=Nonomuraea sp. NPDC050663 TaxID=3364370 RepID=UPI0037B9FA1B
MAHPPRPPCLPGPHEGGPFRLLPGRRWPAFLAAAGLLLLTALPPGAASAGRGTAEPGALSLTSATSSTLATTMSSNTVAEPSDAELARDALRADLSRERFYFAMTDRFANGDTSNDRGGLTGDRGKTGFDPTDKGYYQGGDLKGLLARLDYIQGLGTTALWITPAFKNKPVQGDSAGYHGYWITDFTRIDPHLGTNAEMKTLVKQAHKRGMKVFFDIITNHTADVVDYKEKEYGYRSKGAYPYVSSTGQVFDDRAVTGFPKVDAESFPYTPVATDASKKPAWLNDVTMYHNRGDSTFSGESSEYGDFFGLDDLWTERPEVLDGMIDIYRSWVREAGVDGFRIDTAKHVDMGFWEKFSPALRGYAAQLGNKRFFMFGEVFSSDAAFTSRYSTRGGMNSTLDFPFQDAAVAYAARRSDAGKLASLFASDDYHLDADSNASSLPTFLGNHDIGRVGNFLRGTDDPLGRDRLAHELMYLVRGQPVVYYGDEQGFTGAGGDKDARAPMFASRSADYLDDDLLGTDATHAQDNYVTTHPLYQAIARLAALRDEHPALADGAQIERLASGGVYAFSRVLASERVEYVVAVNNGTTQAQIQIPTDSPSTGFIPVYTTTAGAGRGAQATAGAGSGAGVQAAADGRLAVTVPALSAVVYKAAAKLPDPAAAPQLTLSLPGAQIRGTAEDGRVAVTATAPGAGFAQVTFAAQVGDGEWKVLGTDDAPNAGRTFRIFHDLRGIPAGTVITYKAVVEDSAGRTASAKARAEVGPDPLPEDPGAVKRDHLVVHYQRDDYDGWGLHVWGDVEQPTEWGAPLALTGEDSFGRFAWIKLKPGATTVGIIAHKGDEKDGGDRLVNVAQRGEVWLAQGKPDTYGSRQAAEGFATIHYKRADAAYDGWGLHLWGDAVQNPTDWSAPMPATGTDSFGAFWKVPLKSPEAPVNFIIHKGDEKDPGPDQSFTGAQAYVVSGASAVHATRAAAENTAILHYHRPDGAYSGWGLHVWSGAATPTEWSAPLEPAGSDAFGVYWKVPLAEGAKSLSFIIHKGDEKDQAADQSLDLVATGHEAWKLSGADGFVLPQAAAAGADADLSKARAHWIDRETVAWQVKPSSALHYALAFGDTAIDLAKPYRTIRLVPGALTDAQKAKWPHLKDYAALKVDPRDADLAGPALLGAIAAVERDAAGRLLTATGVQIPGVLDDLYATDQPLGPTGTILPRLALWAPTARKVELKLGGKQYGMRRDADGVWSVRGLPTWYGKDYTFLVTVYSPAEGKVVTNEVTDPYSLALAPDSVRSRLVNLDAERPGGWTSLRKPAADGPSTIYELHVRDFSASDPTVPQVLRGTYKAFTQDSAGMRELRKLAEDGLTYVHLLPVFDIGTVPEVKANRTEPACDLASMPPDSELQQECVAKTAAKDSFNWGYDPLHYTVPDGSYATDPDRRVREFREMVAALNKAGLRVVMDVVYNHTHSVDVFDKIVPGYYHRRLDDGTVATSTCCPGTAPEHAMMGRLVVDSVVTWAREYKIDGFRFDLMGHHPKANLLAVRQALDALTVAKDGVDGKKIVLYGEGWDFGEVAQGARFEQATQANLAGTGIGTFSDRLRDAVRGGGPFDADPRVQGFGSGRAATPDTTLRAYQNLVMLGLTGNLKDYVLPDGRKGSQVDYNGSPAGYAGTPRDVVTYVDAHDNETLYDALAYKFPGSMAERVRMQTLSLATALLGQGTAFLHAGSERLRSKSLDRNSYDSGDWFNRLLWDCSQGNGFGGGLPPRADNESKWAYAKPLLADPALKPDCAAINGARARFGEFLRIRSSSPAFALGSLAEVQRRVSFPASAPGVVTMRIDAEGVDPSYSSITVVFNATPAVQQQIVPGLGAARLHPVQAAGDDAVVWQAKAEGETLTVPGMTVAVFVTGK